MLPGKSSNLRSAGSTQRFGVLVEQWEEAWQAGAAPNLSAFLSHAPTEGRPALLLELLPIDLEQRWRRADAQETLPQANDDSLTHRTALPPRPRLEDYAAAFPQLQPLAELPPHLIAWEFYVRHRYGDCPPREEYFSRFPAQAVALERELVQIEAALVQMPRRLPEGNPPTTSHTVLGQLGPYELLAEIGRGGMGQVFQARHRLMDRLVALKIPAPELVRSADGRERFLREARSAARLKHPHICTVHDVVEEGGQPYIVMDFVRGVTLREWAQTTQPNARQIAETLAALARAVGYAHEHGVLHRDLKPGNAMIDAERGQPVLMDFGLAKELSDLTSDLTHTGQVMGTPAYMAPEQAAGRMDQVGPAADIYSLGAILYELLCGAPPFVGPVGEVLRRVQTEEPLAPRKVAPRVHVDLETVCLKALAKDPAQRYATAVALAEDLERFASGEGILARRASFGLRLWRKVRRSPAVAAAVVVTVLAIATASVLALHSAATRKLAAVQGRVETALDALDGTPARLAEVETLLAELAALAPQQAEADRARALDAHAAALERRIRQTAALSTADFEELTAALADLAARDASAAERLQAALEQRQQQWQPLFEATAETPVEELFESEQVQRTETGWQTQFVRHMPNAQPIYLRGPAAGDIRAEAVFGPNLGPATEIGLVLNASTAHTGLADQLAFSPDGRYLASGGQDQTVKVWEATGGSHVATLHGHDWMILNLCFLADSRTILTCDGLVRAWSLPDGRRVPLPFAESGRVRTMIASADGHVVALVSFEGAVRICDFRQGPELREFPLESPVADLALSSDGRRLAYANADAARIVEVATGRLVATLEGKLPQFKNCFKFAGRDGFFVCAGGHDDGTADTVLTWDAATGARLETPFQSEITYSAGAADLAPVVVIQLYGGGFLGVETWELEQRRRTNRILFGRSDPPWGVTLSRDGSRLAAGWMDGTLRLWDATSGRELLTAEDASYTLSLRSTPRAAAAGDAPAAETLPALPLSDATAQVALEIRRGGELLAAAALPDWRPSPAGVRLVASREGQRLTLRLDDEHVVEFDDVFAGPTAAGERWGLVWSAGSTLLELRAARRETGAGASPLERGDLLLARGDAAAAFDFYEQTARSEAGTELSQEARYKAALCFERLQREAEAEAQWQALSQEPGERWPLLATCQMWLRLVAAQRWSDADALLASLTARFDLSRLVQLMPIEERQRIAGGYLAFVNATSFYQLDDDVVAQLQRSLQVAQLVDLPIIAENSAWRLMRCLQVLGRHAEATELIRTRLREPLVDIPEQKSSWASELAWTLRMQGDTLAALRALDETAAEIAGQPNVLLRQERARTLCLLGRSAEALREIDALVAEHAAMGDAQLSGVLLLLQGMLRTENGDPDGGLASWRAAREYAPSAAQELSATRLFSQLLLGSLTGDLTPAEDAALQATMIAGVSGNAALAGFASVARLPPGVLRDVFRSPRGREWARKLVLRDCTAAEMLKMPLVLLAYETFRQHALPPGASAEQDELIWQLAQRGFERFQTRELQAPQFVGLGLTWKGTTNFLGWGGVGPTLPSNFRAPAAYVFGCRFQHHLQQSETARSFYEEALAHASEQPDVAHLAELALADLAAPPPAEAPPVPAAPAP